VSSYAKSLQYIECKNSKWNTSSDRAIHACVAYDTVMGLRVLRDVTVVYPRKPKTLGLALNGSTHKARFIACIHLYSSQSTSSVKPTRGTHVATNIQTRNARSSASDERWTIDRWLSQRASDGDLSWVASYIRVLLRCWHSSPSDGLPESIPHITNLAYSPLGAVVSPPSEYL